MSARKHDGDLIIKWKVTLPATLAGRVENMLLSPIHNKPIYAARARLIEGLLEYWVALESGSELPPLPSLMDLRSAV
jgi:hypothetical protein